MVQKYGAVHRPFGQDDMERPLAGDKKDCLLTSHNCVTQHKTSEPGWSLKLEISFYQDPHFSRKPKLYVLTERKGMSHLRNNDDNRFYIASLCPFPQTPFGICFSSLALLSKQNGYQGLATLVQILGPL